MRLLCILLVAAGAVATDVVWVVAPNIPEAAGRYEIDPDYPPIRGHLTWVSGNRRIAMGHKCNGNVWLIGNTEAVEQNMGWVCTTDSHHGKPPDKVTGWGRVVKGDWVADRTVHVTSTGPAIPTHLYVVAPMLEHLVGRCTVSRKVNGLPIWKCGDHRWLFTDSFGNWVLGPVVSRDTGWAMARHHAGRLPHLIVDWRRQDDKGGWVEDHTIRMVTAPTPKPCPLPGQYNSLAFYPEGCSEPAERCATFWLDGLEGIEERAFALERRLIYGKKVYGTVDSAGEKHYIYWCPSCPRLAGLPSWRVAHGTVLDELQNTPLTAGALPNCPGWAVGLDTQYGDSFLDSTVQWHVWEKGIESWVEADVSITCYEDLL